MNHTTLPDSPAPEPRHAPPRAGAAGQTRASRKGRALGWILVFLVLGGMAAAFFLRGSRGERGDGADKSPTTVAVAKAERRDLLQDLWLTAEFRPYQEVSLHAKVAGYLKSISVDVGDRVKANQKIAELEIPELEDDLAKASSAYQASLEDVKRAEADFEQANVSYNRLLGVSKEHPKLVAQQELDDAKTKSEAMKGSLGAARRRVDERQSELNRTKTLRDYASIVTPFAGIITKRFADPGALIQAGTASNTQAMPLVELAQQDMLRLVFPVPESAAPTIHAGAPVEVAVSAINETFTGNISRFAGKVDRSTRTMHTEVDVPNPGNKYTPGMYAYVRIILKEQKNALSVPVQALLTGDKPSVYVINTSGVVEQRPVTIGLETPDRVEIRNGVSEGELVIVGSRSGIRSGQKAIGKVVETPAG